ncbi:hypothetical protein [Brytella acorum]|uniref:Uncharacterized protein n=1 Tax=Brytella acorum TaxID=2959299 RepID=A0AA35Y2T6_9PROT|nr:hypothetical protein [Brytella acorum]MDF3624566.1 hypothetical protein [Brytella acorum]CAI9119585.1 hypothetical protein LMG32879_000403 [Brytella acorum]
MLRRALMCAMTVATIVGGAVSSVPAQAQATDHANTVAVHFGGKAHPSSSAFSTIVADGSSNLKTDTAGITSLSTDLVAHSDARAVAASGPTYTDAPVPDEDVTEPLVISDPSTHVRPDFFHRDSHQINAAQDESTSVNEHRRGHGSAAAGLALAVPLY